MRSRAATTSWGPAAAALARRPGESSCRCALVRRVRTCLRVIGPSRTIRSLNTPGCPARDPRQNVSNPGNGCNRSVTVITRLTARDARSVSKSSVLGMSVAVDPVASLFEAGPAWHHRPYPNSCLGPVHHDNIMIMTKKQPLG